MAEIEVFQLTPEVGRCYEYAESTHKLGRYPNEKYFTTNTPRYVGKFLRSENYRDQGFFSYFIDNDGKEQRVDYSYEGNTCFREVPCMVPSLQSLSRNVVKSKVDYSSIPEGSPIRSIIEGTTIGGKSKRRRRVKKKRTKQTKRMRKGLNKKYKNI